MSWRFTEFPYLLKKRPEELRELIIQAARENQGHISNTSEYLGMAKRQLYNYINAIPGLLEQLREIRDEFSKSRRNVPRYLDTSFLGTTVRNDPEQAKRIILWTYADSDEDMAETARKLGISAKRLHGYLRALDILPEVRDLAGRRARARRPSSSYVAA
jgi:DNA-binding NtrC family response regulator